MHSHDCQNRHRLIDRFSVREKMLMRIGFYGFVIVGTIAIFLVSVFWGILYLLFTFGVGAVVAFWAFCPYCPYPHIQNTCLFIPPAVFKRWGRVRQAPMSLSDKIWTLGWLLGILMIPQYWLWHSALAVVLFFGLAVPMLTTMLRYYCQHCRHMACPMNRIPTVP